MTGNMILNEICDLLDTYKGRDKVMRTLCYSTKLISGLTKDEKVAKRFQIFSSQMSKTRAVLRLFDDLPMLKYTIEYGLGKSEPDSVMSSLGVITNVIDQVYYPIEKMSWLAEHDLISADGTLWDTASSVCWVASIYLTLMKSMRLFSILQKHKLNLNVDDTYRQTLSRLTARQNMELLTCVRLSLDLIHAINTLPKGFLWSAKLNTWQVGLVATVSSFLGLYQMFAKRALK